MQLFTNYYKIISRQIKYNFVNLTTNVIGLSLGFAVSIMAFMFIYHEMSYENMHSQANRIYRVSMHSQAGNYDTHWARINVNWLNNMPVEFAGIEHYIRFQNYYPRSIKLGQETFRISHAYSTDAEVFSVFDFSLLKGNPRTALKEPYSVVLTKSMAEKFYGNKEAMEKLISIIDPMSGEKIDYRVTGIMQDVPANSHLPVNMLFSFANEEERTGWAYTYILLKKPQDLISIEENMPAFIEKYTDPEVEGSISFPLQNIKDIHLHSQLAREIIPNGSWNRVFMVGCASLFILIMSLFNCINLKIAQAWQKQREIGIRRMFGSSKIQLFQYFFTDAFFIATVAILLALVLVLMAKPLGSQFLIFQVSASAIATFSILLVMVTSFSIGSYPAIALSNFELIPTIKNQSFGNTRKSRVSLKKILVTVQLCLAIALISSALVFRGQFNYLTHKNLGMEKEQVLALTNLPHPVKKRLSTFKNELLQYTGIENIAAVMEVPSREIRDAGPVEIDGITDPGNLPVMDVQVVDERFIPLMQIELLAGKNFKPNNRNWGSYGEEPFEFLSNQPRTYLINETAMKLAGWDNPEDALGKMINWSIGSLKLQKGPIIGVISDYHQESLANDIESLVFINEPYWQNNLLIKMKVVDIPETLELITATWEQYFPDYEIEYAFLDDLYQNLYQAEEKQTRLISFFTGLAIIIAFLGIFGLLSHNLKTREKELAVRKLLGASVASLAFLVSKSLVGETIIALIIVIPFNWWLLQNWLSQYAYRIQLKPLYFLMALVVVLIVVLLNIVLKLNTVNRNNPAQILRNQ